MKLNLCATIVASVIMLVLLDSAEANKEKRTGHRRKQKEKLEHMEEGGLINEPEIGELSPLHE